MKPSKLTWHWSATGYKWKPDHASYHFVIDGDGNIKQYLSIYEIGAHTWRRNTGNVGIAFAAMYDDPKTKYFDYPVTPIQIERMACLTAELMFKLNIPLDNVRDHAYYAKLDKYYPLRWDIGKLEWIVRAKTEWYYKKLVSGERKIELIKNLF